MSTARWSAATAAAGRSATRWSISTSRATGSSNAPIAAGATSSIPPPGPATATDGAHRGPPLSRRAPRGAAMNDASRPHRLYLIDGSGYIFRPFHALPPLTREDGTPINAVLGFTNMIYKLMNETDADAIAVVFDAGRSSFRNDLYGDYKAHRPEAPP